mmetsp:Transcript_18208/g.47538  ORF Transcript_18208/g.47538 Transcript_18208/m.47538 type:complete len:213 (+) Transcript_18208:96-734(+)
MSAEEVRGYLVLRIEEASGRTKKDEFVWDTNVEGEFQAFVKVDLRGGSRNVKAQTKRAPLIGETVTWREDIVLEVLEGSNELRFLFCRDRYHGGKRGTSVIAACGIFVDDIIEAVPIDKYFELFKPNLLGGGGFIRICMNFVKDLSELQQQPGQLPSNQAAEPQAVQPKAKDGNKGRKMVAVVAPALALLVAAGTGAGIIMQKRRQDKSRRL